MYKLKLSGYIINHLILLAVFVIVELLISTNPEMKNQNQFDQFLALIFIWIIGYVLIQIIISNVYPWYNFSSDISIASLAISIAIMMHFLFLDNLLLGIWKIVAIIAIIVSMAFMIADFSKLLIKCSLLEKFTTVSITLSTAILTFVLMKWILPSIY